MTARWRRLRLPRSYQSGRLLRLLAHDLPGHRLERDGSGVSRFVPRIGGPMIEVTERADRRFLGRNEIAQFRARSPGAGAGTARFEVRHTGRLKRNGVTLVAPSGQAPDQALGDALAADPVFFPAAMTLDFTRFDLERADGEWVATVELMGASFVSLALPPMRSYVRLHPDQREALVAVFTRLLMHLEGR